MALTTLNTRISLMRPSSLLGLAWLTASLLLVGACAQPTATELANDTLAKGAQVVDGVAGKANQVKGDAPGVNRESSPWADAAGAVGKFLEEVGRAIADGATATVQATSEVAAWTAVAASTATSATANAIGASLAAIGSGFGFVAQNIVAGMGAAASAVAAMLGALVGSIGAFVASLRPRTMPEPAFQAVAITATTLAAGGAGWSLWAFLRKYGWLASVVAGFSRIHDSELLEHPMRRQIHDTIREKPGIHASELTRTLGVGWGTIVHHLDKLERARLVAVRRINNQRCYFEAGGQVNRNDMATVGAVRSGSAHEIAQFVASHPMTSQKAMAGHLGMSPALASFHVKKLVQLGVLQKVRRGKETLLSTSDSLRRVLGQNPTPTLAPMPMAYTQA